MISINVIISVNICFAKFTNPILDFTDIRHPDRGFRSAFYKCTQSVHVKNIIVIGYEIEWAKHFKFYFFLMSDFSSDIHLAGDSSSRKIFEIIGLFGF